MTDLRLIQGGKTDPEPKRCGEHFWRHSVESEPLTEDSFLRGMYTLARRAGWSKEPFLVWKERVVHVDAERVK